MSSATSSTEIHVLSTREGYDRWAAIYDSEGNPLIALEEPKVDELLGDVRGLSVADIGCGTGRHTTRLAVAGARVTAADFSTQMLHKAREKVEQAKLAHAVEFVQHDLTQPLPFHDRSFDRVLCGLVLDHISTLDMLFGEMKRICKSEGAIVVSVMHPAMMLKGMQARFTDPQTGQETRPQSCPHQISDYMMAARRADLQIEHVSEHLADQTLADRCPRALKHLGWPLLLMLRLLP